MAGSIANRLSQFLKNGGSFGDINLFDAAKTTTTTMDLFPSSEGKGKASKPQTVGSSSSSSSSSSSAQMTIFYGGQVIVLDGFPSDKAMEIMEAAKSVSSSTSTGLLGGGGASDSNQVELQLKPEVVASAAGSSSDMPIARKVSLRRFLEKRKDRVATRAPYQMNKPVVGLSRPEESRPRIDLEAPPPKHHLELSL